MLEHVLAVPWNAACHLARAIGAAKSLSVGNLKTVAAARKKRKMKNSAELSPTEPKSNLHCDRLKTPF